MHRLPYDVQLAVLRWLNGREIIRLCATCKVLQRLMADRTIWHRLLSRLLVLFPQPQLSRRIAEMTVEELKLQVLLSARLDKLWHGIDYQPRLVRDFQCDRSVEHISLVAGGNWVVVVLYNGTLQLHELGATSPNVTLSHTVSEDESVFHLSSRLSLTSEYEDLIILQMGVRYNQCNIYVYHVAVIDPEPAFVLVGKVSVTGSVWCCASGGELLVYGLDSGEGDMILHVCAIGLPRAATRPNQAHAPHWQVAMNIGPWSADEDFTISVLSEHQLMLAYHGGLFLYEIPQPQLSPPGAADSGQGPHDRPSPTIHAVRPVWSIQCDIGSGIYRISPFTWASSTHARTHDVHAPLKTALTPAPAPQPLVIAGTRALHVLRVLPGAPHVDYREVAYPLTLGAEIGYMGLGAVGLRRAIWDCTEARNGSLHVHFRTYSFPRSILDLAEDGPDDLGARELGLRGKLGSFSVTLDPEEHLVSLCMDESSGRVCLLLNNITTGARRISVIDAI